MSDPLKTLENDIAGVADAQIRNILRDIVNILKKINPGRDD